jgi:primosomal protein N' (replication factor Y)
MSLGNNTITIISPALSWVVAPGITTSFFDAFHEIHALWKKSLIFYNRRWTSRAWICQDCWFFPKCPNCDIALSRHNSPKEHLLCHTCSYKTPVLDVCPNCQSPHILDVWQWIESIQSSLSDILPKSWKIVRVDSDIGENYREISDKIESADIILATSMVSILQRDDIGAVFFPSLELDLSLPEYDIEERLLILISYYKKLWSKIYIQIYSQEHKIISTIQEWNYKDALSYIIDERKIFSYPPFVEHLTLTIRDTSKKSLENIGAHMIRKISLEKQPTTILAFDTVSSKKQWWYYFQKITLKDKNLSYILPIIEIDVLRHRWISLAW